MMLLAAKLLVRSQWFIEELSRSFGIVLTLMRYRFIDSRIWGKQRRMEAPQAALRPWTCVLHGRLISDPYHWLKNKADEAVGQYIQAENRYAEKVMEDTQQFQVQLMDVIKGYEMQLDTLQEVLGKYEYYVKVDGDGSLPIYCRRRLKSDTTTGIEEVILDVNLLSKFYGENSNCSVSAMKVSASQKLVAYVLDIDGKDNYQAHIIDLSGSKPKLIEIINHAFAIEFSMDEKSVVYTKLNSRQRPFQVWLKTLQSNSQDRLIFQENDEKYIAHVSCTKDKQFIIINLNSKSSSEVWALNANQLDANALLIKSREKNIECYVDHSGNKFYIVTNDGSIGKYKIMIAPDSNPGYANWKEPAFNYESPGVILDDIDLFSKHCILYQRENLRPQITVANLQTQNSSTVFKLPLGATDSVSNFTFDSDIARFSHSSPLTSSNFYELDMNDMQLTNVLPASVNLDSNQYNFYTLQVKGKDGCAVPVSLCHHKDIKKNSDNPLLAQVYGAYGRDLNTRFSSQNMCLLKLGWILAFCHVRDYYTFDVKLIVKRGGGELGRDWYYQGRQLHKKNSFSDFQVCLENLQALGYTRASRTACKGISAGGLIVAHLCNTQPNMAAAAIMKVPHVDIIGTMLDPSLPLTIEEYEEWGDLISSQTVFEYIYSYCPYTNIHLTDYPSMLITASYHDNRVPYWSPVRYMAKLRTALCNYRQNKLSHSKKIHVMKIDLSSGHFGTTGGERYKEEAMEIAFLHKSLALPYENNKLIEST